MYIRLLALGLVFGMGVGFAQVPYAGNDADLGVSRVSGFIDPYTGNMAFSTQDLRVSGAVGKRGLSWHRHATSRTSRTEPLFGLGHNWAHGWQWEMVDAGTDSQGRAVISVRLPQGWVHRFTETSPGEWWPAPSIRDRVTSAGDSFIVYCSDASEIRFARERTASGSVFTLREIADPESNVWKLDWADGKLVQVTEPAGRWLKIGYNEISAENASVNAKPFQVISEVSSSDGQKVVYHYAFENGADYPVLSKVDYPDGTSANYTYRVARAGERALLTRAQDPHGDRELRGRTFGYRGDSGSAFGQLLEVRSADNGAVMDALAFDKSGSRSYAVRKDNGSTVYRLFTAGGLLAETIDALGYSKKHEYDANGRGFKIATTDELGHITRLENDANGAVVKTIFPDGAFKSWQRDDRGRVLAETDELGYTRKYTRDTRGRVTKVEFQDGSSTETTYNKFGQPVATKSRGGAVTTMAYEARGLRTKIVNALGGTTTYTYDIRDRVATVTDARGNTTRYEHDTGGRVIKTIYADGASISASYDDFGNVVSSVDSGGAERRMVYDGYGRLIASVNALGHEARTEYAPVGDSAPLRRPIQTISPGGRVTAMVYDQVGRLAARTLAAGTEDAATTRMAYDATGRQISTTDPLGRTVKFSHDERGRRIKTITALKHVTTDTYDAAGRKLSRTDANGNATHWTYDSMGREISKIDAKGQVTRREYNAAGKLSSLIDAKGNVYRFEYDPLGRQTALVYPDGSREVTAYDAAGLKLSETSRAGVMRTFTYDNRNREVRSEWGDGTQAIIKAYDMAGRMTLEDNGTSKLTFSYDAVGRLISETQDISPIVSNGLLDPERQTVSYTYNDDGLRETLGYPDGGKIRYSYDGQGRLTQLFGEGSSPLAAYEYDRAGNPTLMPRENATATTREFDAENRTLAIIDRVATRRSPLNKVDYVYDGVGNRTATVSNSDSDGQGTAETLLDAYHYDDIYQIDRVDYGAGVTGNQVGAPATTVSFTYDEVGNRAEVNEDGLVTRYAANNLNQYVKVGAVTPAYDANGNLSKMGAWLYRYDSLNRLVFASNGVTTVKFWYDAKNRCVARSYQQQAASRSLDGSPSITLYTYDSWNMMEERASDGLHRARYIHGRSVDEVIALENSHGVFYPHRDVLGSVSFLTDIEGGLVERYSYSVDGRVTITNHDGKILTKSSVGNRWLYAGRELIEGIGIYDYRNRMYEPITGRFMQRDPMVFDADDINIYRYVGNQYMSLVDPYGLWAIFMGADIDLSFMGGGSLSFGVSFGSDGNDGVWATVDYAVGANAGAGVSIGYVDRDVHGFSQEIDINGVAMGMSVIVDGQGINGWSISYGPGYGISVAERETAIVDWTDWWNWWGE